MHSLATCPDPLLLPLLSVVGEVGLRFGGEWWSVFEVAGLGCFGYDLSPLFIIHISPDHLGKRRNLKS
jgi:hypothetical protein